MQIITDFSWFGISLCIALGAAYAIVLYALGKKHRMSAKTRLLLAVPRFLAIFLISFLLLSPMLKTSVTETEKPVVLLLQDNSQSIVLNKDSAYYRNEYLQNFNDLQKSLSDKYAVEVFSFGGSLQNGFDGTYSQPVSDISLALNEIQDMYKGRNVGAVVLATDGIYNSGSQPSNLAPTPYPIYTIALGDTAVRKDAAINNLTFNRITYLNSVFPVEISVKASKLKGQNKRLTVEKNGKALFSKKLQYSSNDFFTTETVTLEADKAGVQLYTVRLETSDGEVSVANNVRTFAVEVIDSRRKIAVIGQVPHPDLGALKRQLQSVETYDVESFLADDFKQQLSQYDIIILHQLPSEKMEHNTLVDNVLKSQVPVLFVLGQQTSFRRFDGLRTGLAINRTSDRSDEATAALNSAFPHFAIDGDMARKLESFPPLSVPFGKYSTAEGVQTLLFAKIGNVVTDRPLVAFAQKNSTRYGFVIGDGLWRWWLADYQQNSTHDNIGTLLEKAITFLSLRLDKDKFRINAKAAFAENEAIIFEAELYNDNFEPVTSADITIAIAKPDGTSSTFAFEPRGNTYFASAGSLPQGSYTYSATAAHGGKKLSKKGAFVVERLCLEQNSLTADHALLNTIAEKTGGRMLAPQHLDSLPALLDQRSEIRNIIFQRYKNMELIHLPWIFVLIVALLAVEWVARRYKNEI